MNELQPRRVALVTAVYPGVEPFLPAWYQSVREQEDREFDLWIATDGLDVESVVNAIGEDPGATWVPAADGDTPAQVRQRVLGSAAERYDATVLVDADDVLLPSRVAQARRRLATADLSACALRLIDAQGRDLGAELPSSPHGAADDVLPRTNLFGLSNSAYRCGLLRRCLPIPASARAVDWFLATRAWLLCARLDLDPVARMGYRQHAANMTTVQAPIEAWHVRRDTPLVAAHAALVAAASLEGVDVSRIAAIQTFAADVDAFARAVVGDPARLAAYVLRLARLPFPMPWWSHVAHPALRDLWR